MKKIVVGLWIVSQGASTSLLKALTSSWLTTSGWGESALGGCPGCPQINRRQPESHCAIKCWGIFAKNCHWMSPGCTTSSLKPRCNPAFGSIPNRHHPKVRRQGGARDLFWLRWLGDICTTSSKLTWSVIFMQSARHAAQKHQRPCHFFWIIPFDDEVFDSSAKVDFHIHQHLVEFCYGWLLLLQMRYFQDGFVHWFVLPLLHFQLQHVLCTCEDSLVHIRDGRW